MARHKELIDLTYLTGLGEVTNWGQVLGGGGVAKEMLELELLYFVSNDFYCSHDLVEKLSRFGN